jgi:hypothetical protein
MPLPQQVINQLSRDTTDTPGFSWGILSFSGGLFVLVLVIYFFMSLVYGPYLNNKLSDVQTKVATVDQSISSGDETHLVAFYSQLTNLQSLLGSHIIFSRFLAWLGQNTQANVSYDAMAFSSGNQVTLTGKARTEADINQQIAIFESSPMIQKVIISNVGLPTAGGLWTFSAQILMNPSIFTASTTQS